MDLAFILFILFKIIWYLISFVVSYAFPIIILILFILWRRSKKKNTEKTEVINKLYDIVNSNSSTSEFEKQEKIEPAQKNSQTDNLDKPVQINEDKEIIGDTQVSNEVTTINEPVKYAAESSEQTLLSQEELEIIKHKRNLFNINLALYISSFLIVAAISTFLTTNSTVSSLTKFLIIAFATSGFYLAGLIIYKKSTRLKPAAVAFTSTGLATLPFIGVALNQFIIQDTPIAWLIASIVGLAAYVIAAFIINNQILSYLSVGFVISTVLSATSVSHAPLIAYFVVLILFGTTMSILSLYAKKYIPRVFILPIENTNEWIVPLTLFASLVSYNTLNLSDYIAILLLGSLYYFAIGFSSLQRRKVAYFISRLMLIFAILIFSYQSGDGLISLSITICSIGFFNTLSSVFLLSIKNKFSEYLESKTWLSIGLIMQSIAPFTLALVQIPDIYNLPSFDFESLLNNQALMLVVSIEIGILVLTSLTAALVLKIKNYSIAATFGLAVLPYIVCSFVIVPPLSNIFISFSYLALAIIVLMIRYIIYRKNNKYTTNILNANYGVFLAESLFFSLNIDHPTGIALWLIAIFSYIFLIILEKSYERSFLANILIFIMIYVHVYPLNLPQQTIPLIYLSASSFIMLVVFFSKSIISERLRYSLLFNSGLFIASSLLFATYIRVDDTWGFITWVSASFLTLGLTYLSKVSMLSLVANAMLSFSIWTYVYDGVHIENISLLYTGLASLLIMIRILMIKNRNHPIFKEAILYNIFIFLAQSIFGAWGSQNINFETVIFSLVALLVYALTYIDKTPYLALISNTLLIVVFYNLPLIRFELIDQSLHFILTACFSLLWFSSVYFLLRLFNRTKYLKEFLYSSLAAPNIFCIIALATGPSIAQLITIALISFASILTLHYEGYMSKNNDYIKVSIILENVLLTSVFYNLARLLNNDTSWIFIISAASSVLVFGSIYFVLKLIKNNIYNKYYLYSCIIVANVLYFLNIINSDLSERQNELSFSGLISIISWAILLYDSLKAKKINEVTLSIVAINLLGNIIVKIKYPEVDFLLYTHWWAAAMIVLGAIYIYLFKEKNKSKILLYSALSLISIPTGLVAIDFPYKSLWPVQVIFLVEQAAILIIGMALRLKLVTIWGATSIILAVVWLVRGYTVILLIIIAALIMSGAIYGLLRIGKSPRKDNDEKDLNKIDQNKQK